MLKFFRTALRYWDYKENRESWNPVSARLSRQEAGRVTDLSIVNLSRWSSGAETSRDQPRPAETNRDQHR